ncbi:uncharacterized protein LOC107816454 [Nicotiana tabacum]|uniref:Uncharacterized protein LOC107816454 n=1 Tax=Nicotiana tabacum TaxID=4097 RepID=A0A1S4C952_TOBAC|nr:PREDICTED: uncharacterized protein LOC107816454 [Nicotiana tabacum]
MAEYEACILGLIMVIDMNVQELLVTRDFDLLVHQNEFADAWATLYSMIQHPNKNLIDLIPIEIRKQPAYCAHVEELSDENPWFHDIKEYFEKGEHMRMLHTSRSARFEGWPTISFRAKEFYIEECLI